MVCKSFFLLKGFQKLAKLWTLSFQMRMPGSSERGFLGSLSDIAVDNGRVGHIQIDAFSNAFKEYKYIQYELDLLRNVQAFDFPLCKISQHAAMFDGNMKTYRYKSAGRYFMVVYGEMVVGILLVKKMNRFSATFPG
eukprot:gene4102-4658_t